MKKAIMLKNSVHVSEGKIVENATFSYVYVDDPETMPVEDDPSGTTAYFPIRHKGGLEETMEWFNEHCKKCQFAAVQINPDGIHLMIVRGADRRSVAQDAAYMVLCLFGIFLDAETLLRESRYECDGTVWWVLPYEYNQTMLV